MKSACTASVFSRLFAVLLSLFLLLSLCACSASAQAIGSPAPSEAVIDAPQDSPEASAQPTPSPTPEPTPAPTPEPTPLPDLESGYYDSFYDDAVFIGDSVTQGLQIYVLNERNKTPNLLGAAKFAAVAKYGLNLAAKPLNTSQVTLKYRGTSMTPQDIVKAMEAKKVFIMLGLNNWAGSNIKPNIEYYRTLIANILAENPDAAIYVETCTPIAKAGEKPEINNENVDEFNAALKALCEEVSVHFVDISTPLKGGDNALKPEYTSDKYVHMTAKGFVVWINVLRQLALEEYQAGNWIPPEPTPAPVETPAA